MVTEEKFAQEKKIQEELKTNYSEVLKQNELDLEHVLEYVTSSRKEYNDQFKNTEEIKKCLVSRICGSNPV